MMSIAIVAAKDAPRKIYRKKGLIMTKITRKISIIN